MLYDATEIISNIVITDNSVVFLFAGCGPVYFSGVK